MYGSALRLGLMLLSLVLLGLLAWDFQRLQDLQSQTESAERSLIQARDYDKRVQTEARAAGMDLSDAALEHMARDVTFANQLIAKRTFSWTHFLTDLEQAIPPRIAINSVKLDTNESSIALNGLAVSLKDLAALIMSLLDHPSFQDPVLKQHNVLDNTLVEFNLTVRYANVASSQRPQPSKSSPKK
jgi:Tfp pilus assembly protein PilN